MTEGSTPNQEYPAHDESTHRANQADARRSGDTTQVPADWYPDPNDDTLLRYFDGTAWTEHTSPRYTTAEGVDPGRAQADAAKQARAAERAQRRDEAKAQRTAAREAKQAEKAAARADELARYGVQVANEIFGTKMIRIYSKGYAKVGTVLFGGSSPFEKLVSIEFSADVQKKTGIGRAAVGVMTLGANMALSPNKRGDVYLTIVTERQTHVLHESPPTAQLMKAGHALEAAGRSVLNNLPSSGGGAPEQPAPSAAAPSQPSTAGGAEEIAARLAKIEQLHAEGLITDDEGRQRRQEILRDI